MPKCNGGFLGGFEATRLDGRAVFRPSLRAHISHHRPAALRHGLGCPDLRGVYGDRGSGACERAVDVHPRYSLMDLRLGPGSQRSTLSHRTGEKGSARWSRAGTPGAPSRLRVEMNDVGTT